MSRKPAVIDPPIQNRYNWRGGYLVFKGVNVAQVLYDDSVLAAASSAAASHRGEEKLFFKVVAFNDIHGIVSATSFETIGAAKEFAKSWHKDGPAEATKPFWLKEADRKADGKPQMTNAEKAAMLAIKEHTNGQDEDGHDDAIFGSGLRR